MNTQQRPVQQKDWLDSKVLHVSVGLVNYAFAAGILIAVILGILGKLPS